MDGFKVYRKWDTIFLRKWVVEYWLDGDCVDQRRMFGGLGFQRRLRRKVARMEKMRLNVTKNLGSNLV